MHVCLFHLRTLLDLVLFPNVKICGERWKRRIFLLQGREGLGYGHCSLFICLLQRKSPDTAHFRSLLS